MTSAGTQAEYDANLALQEAREEIIAAAAMNTEKLNLRGILVFRQPLQVKTLAVALGHKNYQTIRDLMNLNVFASQNSTIEPDVAADIAELYGWRLRVDRQLVDRYFFSIRLRTLPLEIGHCRGLKTLLLENNDLTTLPREILECRGLRSIFLRNNHNLGIPPEILEARVPYDNAPALLDYYFARQKGVGRPLNEVKLIFVGRGGVGKSSLVERLIWKRFIPSKKETPGVVLSDWVMNETSNGPVLAHVWDFAGQTITHSMHQFFLSVRTVYVLVVTGRENSEREDCEYWLRLISAFGMDTEGNGPPVIIVLNKWNDPGSARARLDRRALKERYPFIADFVETDCKTKKGLNILKERLYSIVEGLRWVREVFPAEYRLVKDRLEQSQQSYLPYDVYRQICNECGVLEEERQDLLAENLHQLGVALNYRQDDRLRFASVLKPRWITENVYRLVRLAQRSGGLLTKDSLPQVLRYEAKPEMRQFLVDIMVLFELAYPLAEEGTKPKAWLVPQALPDSQPPGVEMFRDAVDSTRLRYTYRTLPVSIVPRFIVRTHPLIDGEMRWASGVVLTLNNARALVRANYVDRQIEVSVLGPTEARRELAGLAQREFRFINGQVKGLDPIEETQAAGEWVLVKTLEHDELHHRKTGVATDMGTVDVDPSIELNEFSAPAARDDSWKPRVFISYSHTDEAQRKKLDLYLKVLATHGILHENWHDRKIQPGEDWDKTIKVELEKADVVLFLVSNAALASDYIQTVEMNRAFERQAAGEIRLIPIILEDCEWKLPQLRKIQALPKDSRPVRDWSPQSKGWKSVSDGLRGIFEELRTTHVAP